VIKATIWTLYWLLVFACAALAFVALRPHGPPAMTVGIYVYKQDVQPIQEFRLRSSWHVLWVRGYRVTPDGKKELVEVFPPFVLDEEEGDGGRRVFWNKLDPKYDHELVVTFLRDAP